MAVQNRNPWSAVVRIAEKQHGAVTRLQLLGAGMTRNEIAARVKSGLLLPVHRGVYRVGHCAPSREATYMAAVLACGPGAVLRGKAAAHLLGVIKGRPPQPEVLTLNDRRIAHITTVRSRATKIHPRDKTIWLGIPTTSPARTLVDLASVLPLDALARACHEAGVIHKTTPAEVEEVLKRRPSSPGASGLREVLTGRKRIALSYLEEEFLKLLEELGLPLPITNRPAGGHRVDCRWPDRRLTVELDSYRFHNSRHAWEKDHQREREARARGDDFRRYTYDEVTTRSASMVAELERTLS